MALQLRHFACHLHREQHRKTGAGAQVRRQRDMDRATRIAGTPPVVTLSWMKARTAA
jgi:hypothetical protein